MLCERFTIHKHSLILTVNQRLSLELARRFQADSQLKAWPSLSILPLTTWIKSLWNQYAIDGTLLNPLQEFNLWLQIIESDHNTLIINPVTTAKLVQQAWQMIGNWQLDIFNTHNQGNQDYMAFERWSRIFENRLKENDWITESMLPERLINLLEEIPLSTQHSSISLVGFDELSPALDHLIKELQKYIAVDIQPTLSPAAHVEVHSFINPEEELRHCIRWAHENIKNNTHSKIAIIVPNLEQQRSNISAILHEQQVTDYNISAGKPLQHYNIIQSALDALALTSHEIDVSHSMHWLQSPYLTMNDMEIAIGAELDVKLRLYRHNKLPFTTLLDELTTLSTSKYSNWINRLQSFLQLLRNQDSKQKMSKWSLLWCELLQALGWPGGRILNSLEFQLLDRFKQALEEFCCLDLTTAMVTNTQAVSMFKQHISEITFQPEGSRAPLQILGMLESAGLQFDAIWVVGLDNETWPQTAKPNPFLPIALQRKHNTPHSSAERELAFTKIITERLLNSAKTVCFSWPKNRDKRSLQSSGLLINIMIQFNIEEISNQFATYDSHRIDNEVVLECFSDENSMPINTEERIAGGSSILQLQATCPFKAFAFARLKLQPLQTPQIGITPQDRGSIVHSVLENIWNTLEDQRTLLSLSNTQLENLIHDTVNTTIDEFKSQHKIINSVFWEFERERLYSLIKEWLDLEKSRKEFIVLAHEEQRQIELCGLKLNLKIDRIDQLTSGEKIIIDYKTGKNHIGGWFGPRLEQPQLPLYCAYASELQPASGISYAEVRPHQTELIGVTCETLDMLPKKIQPINQIKGIGDLTWSKLLQQWRDSLAQLSYEFCAGKSCVEPINKSACLYCELQPFCRVNA